MGEWVGTWTILSDNKRDQEGDSHGVNRPALVAEGLSPGWFQEGIIEIKQKMRILCPVQTQARWSLNISLKLVNAANGQYLTYSKKQGYISNGEKLFDGGQWDGDPQW